MKTLVISLVVFIMASFNVMCQVFSFENDKTGQKPEGFLNAMTGNGSQSDWVVVDDNSRPGNTKVLAQKSTESVDYHFPLCINQSIELTDLTISVKFKPFSGKMDQAAGLVWRYKDNNNYYVVRGNALEDNVVLYKCENGKRISLAPVGTNPGTYGKSASTNKTGWNDLKVIVKGNKFDVYFNGNLLYSVVDDTFKDKGKVGLWTKADSYILFDDFVITN